MIDAYGREINYLRCCMTAEGVCRKQHGDIRPRVVAALEYPVGRIKAECVSETEIDWEEEP